MGRPLTCICRWSQARALGWEEEFPHRDIISFNECCSWCCSTILDLSFEFANLARLSIASPGILSGLFGWFGDLAGFAMSVNNELAGRLALITGASGG